MKLYVITIYGHTQFTTQATSLDLVCNTLGASEQFTANVKAAAEDFEAYALLTNKKSIGGSEEYRMTRLAHINEVQFERFADVFFCELESQYADKYEAYKNGTSLANTFNLMCVAIAQDNFDKDNLSIKNTCKVLGIKHTYKAIQAFLSKAD